MSLDTGGIRASLASELPEGTLICRLDEVPAAGGHVARVSRGGIEISLIVVRQHGAVRCFLNRCPHLGSELAREDRHLYLEPGVSIECNVHYAAFRWSDGVCVRGNCLGEALIGVPVTVDKDGIRVGAWPGNTRDISEGASP